MGCRSSHVGRLLCNHKSVNQPSRPRAVAYIRVSKVGSRGDELKSPEIQLHEIRQHAQRFGYELSCVVEDIDKSGRDFRKRRVAEIVERIKAGEFEKVLLWKWSRWGRNTMENLMWLARVEDAGGDVEAATEHFDATTAYGEFSRTMILAMAQLQGRNIGDGWRETHETRRRAQLPHTSAPRFGYTYDRGKQRYEVNESEAALLRSAYERYVQGTVNFRSLAAEWNDLGVRNSQDRRWSPASVKNTLDTGFAAGLIRERSKQPRPGQPNSRRIVDFDIWREGVHEAIISNELWVVYKEMRIASAQLAPVYRQPKFALSGMLFCPECGQTLKSNTAGPGGKWRSWGCRNGWLKAHRPVNVGHIKAMKQVAQWLTDEATGGESLSEDAQRIIDQRLSAKTELDNLQADLDKQQRLLDRLQESWLLGDFERDFYERRKAELAAEIGKLTEQVVRSKERDVRGEDRPTVEELGELSERWPLWSENHQRAALSRVVRGIVVVTPNSLLVVPAWD